MSMKSRLYALELMAAMLDGGMSGTTRSVREAEPLTPEQIQKKKEEQWKAQGLKPFNINGKVIWALNEKNAIKKYNKS